MRKSMKEIAEILDDVIESKSLSKSLTWNPAKIQEMTQESSYYNPYRMLPDGTFFPHPREYWVGQGKSPEGYQNVFQHYREAGHYQKSFDKIKDSVDDLFKGGPGSGRHKLLGSSGSLDGAKKLIGEFWRSKHIELKDNGDGTHKIHNKNGHVEGFHVREHKGRYRFEMKKSMHRVSESDG